MKSFFSRGAWMMIVSCALLARGQDMPLSQVLINGEDWKVVAEGYQFTDAACGDAEGNFYFTDVGKGTTVNRIGLDGKVTAHFSNTPKISGLKFGPDGRLFAATQGPAKQIVAFDKSGKMEVIASDVQPNDLVVNAKGWVYFTDTGKGEVVSVDPTGKKATAARGINKPNGIALSPDLGTLAVSEYGASNVWAFRVEADGSLTAGERYMTLQCPTGSAVSGGDGMTTDTAGRYYVTSNVGIQIFDPTGRICGVLTKPQNRGAVSVGFGGAKHEYLYVCCTDKIYRRKTQVEGALYFVKPAAR